MSTPRITLKSFPAGATVSGKFPVVVDVLGFVEGKHEVWFRQDANVGGDHLKPVSVERFAPLQAFGDPSGLWDTTKLTNDLHRFGWLVKEIAPATPKGANLSNGYRDVYVDNKAPVPDPGTVQWPSTPIPAYTPNKVAATPNELAAAERSLKAGDVLEVRALEYQGQFDLGVKIPEAVGAEIHFLDGVKFTKGNALGVWAHCANLRCYGGDISGAANDGIRVQSASADSIGPQHFTWFGFKSHDNAANGLLTSGVKFPNVDIRMAGEVYNNGQDLHLDPHAQEGTGFHGGYLGGGLLPTTGFFALEVHDQPTGSAIEIGANLQDAKVYVRPKQITFNVDTEPPGPNGERQVAGNAIVYWGGNNRNVDAYIFDADGLAGRVVEADDLQGGVGLRLVYARATGSRLTPHYVTKGVIQLGDVKPLP